MPNDEAIRRAVAYFTPLHNRPVNPGFQDFRQTSANGPARGLK